MVHELGGVARGCRPFSINNVSGKHALPTSCPSLSGAALLYVPLGVGFVSSLTCAPGAN
jgi:hypothetical protein